MTRTNAGLTWVVAIVASAFVAVPVAAADGYESLNSVTGNGAESASYASLNSVAGSGAAPSDSQAVSTTDSTPNAILASSQPRPSDSPSSLNSILADSPPASGHSPAVGGDSYRTVTSVVGDEQPPSTLVEVRESSGFDWGDSLIGALVAIALMLMAAVAARLLSQQRRTAAASRA